MSSVTAGEYVSSVNTELRNLVRRPTLERLGDFTEACSQGVLDQDVEAAFSKNSNLRNGCRVDACWSQMEQAMNARTPEGDRLFRKNGFAAIADRNGFIAVHAVFHPTEIADEQVDPVEREYPNYSNMALIKTGRAIVSAAHPDQNWEFLGQAHSSGLFAGVTGGLFMHGREGQKDIRAEILANDVGSGSLEAIKPVDYAAGLADQYRAELALGLETSPVSVESIRKRAEAYIQAGINIH